MPTTRALTDSTSFKSAVAALLTSVSFASAAPTAADYNALLTALGKPGAPTPAPSPTPTPSSTLTALRATNAGFAPVLEFAPSGGLAATTRIVTAPFNEPFLQFRLVYALFRIRSLSCTAKVDDGSGNAGNILTVTAISTGAVTVGQYISNAGLGSNVRVVSQLSGDACGVGTYQLSGAAATIASGTFTGDGWTDELFQGAGAQIAFDAGFLDTASVGFSNIPPRTAVTFDGGAAVKNYNYATWDKTQGLMKSDWMTRPGGASAAPLELWTRATLPSVGAGLPANKALYNTFRDRGAGFAYVSAGTSPDPVSATSITAASNGSLGYVPVAIEIMTAGGACTVAVVGDSRSAFTGLAATGGEPAGYGDAMGDANGLGSSFERGIHDVARQHSLMVGKPSDRATWYARSPGAMRFRRQVMALGSNVAGAKRIINAYGQNDQNGGATVNPLTTWAANMDLPLGLTINSSNNIYVVMAGGTGAAVAPSSTITGVDIAHGSATLRFVGTSTTQAQAYNMAGRMMAVNKMLRGDMPNAIIIQEALGPFTSSGSITTALTSSGTTATATIPAAHAAALSVGQTITLTGAVPAGYNGTATVTAVSGQNVSYTLPNGGAGLANATTQATLSDNWATGPGQADGFTVNKSYRQLVPGNPALTGADLTISQLPFLGGSRTANGAADDGSATWATSPTGTVQAFATPDGIHHGNYGAELGKQAFTKAALGAA